MTSRSPIYKDAKRGDFVAKNFKNPCPRSSTQPSKVSKKYVSLIYDCHGLSLIGGLYANF